jgi:outer membrane protein OmpA-like peptidoglycan-associated protein
VGRSMRMNFSIIVYFLMLSFCAFLEDCSLLRGKTHVDSKTDNKVEIVEKRQVTNDTDEGMPESLPEQTPQESKKEEKILESVTESEIFETKIETPSLPRKEIIVEEDVSIVENKAMPSKPDIAKKLKKPEKAIAAAKDRIYFSHDATIIDSSHYPFLHQLIKFLKNNPSYIVEIMGNCDSQGEYVAKICIADQRAVSVCEYLKANGIDAKRIKMINFGARELEKEKNQNVVLFVVREGNAV